MARKYDLISELYRRTADRVVSSQQSWQRLGSGPRVDDHREHVRLRPRFPQEVKSSCSVPYWC